MPRAAVIEAGKVVNIVAANPDEVGPNIIDIEAQPQVAIGWSYDGTTFTAPPPAPRPVPVRVEMAQARLALLQAGKLALVDAAIEALPEPARSAARVEWEFRSHVRRDAPLVTALGPALGLDAAALDDLFRLAETL